MSELAHECRALAEAYFRAGDIMTAATFHVHALMLESHVVADFDLIGQEPLGSPTGDQGLSVGMEQGVARLGMARQGGAWLGTARRGTARQGKAR